MTPAEALAHPTWEMGGRITIDSATLMNKGLEVIEAHHLFGVGYERIDVVVHPQSIVHSLIELNDGAQLAHLGLPDMRVPISYALHYPERADVTVPRLDLAAVGAARASSSPTSSSSPACGSPARPGIAGGTAPCALNAADEVAVAAFLDGAIPFTGDRRGDRRARSSASRPSRSATSSSCSSATRGPASSPPSWSRGRSARA